MEKENRILMDKFGNRHYFCVPENYFENFAAAWAARTATFKPAQQAGYIIRTWLYMAAMFTAVFLMGHFAFLAYQNQKQETATNYELYLFSQVEESDIIDYLLTSND
jgi:predicted CDP-diglyceride synthetase/phosphatidate cytidylyltransferase